jgi:lincosamide nucleotidyltransferase A/C/D/E
MPPHVMDSMNALRIVSALRDAGVDATVGGGWGIDALLGRQTRPHSDLDLWVAAEDLDALIKTFVHLGIDRLYPWGADRPWNFVVHDGHELRVDLHFYERLSGGQVHYGSVRGGDVFDVACLRGKGTIAGAGVVCDSPEWALQCHTGYLPRSVDRHDVTKLCAQFGLPLPDGFRAP